MFSSVCANDGRRFLKQTSKMDEIKPFLCRAHHEIRVEKFKVGRGAPHETFRSARRGVGHVLPFVLSLRLFLAFFFLASFSRIALAFVIRAAALVVTVACAHAFLIPFWTARLRRKHGVMLFLFFSFFFFLFFPPSLSWL